MITLVNAMDYHVLQHKGRTRNAGAAARYFGQLPADYRVDRGVRPGFGQTSHRAAGQGLFEIRTKGREGIARSVFCTVKDQEIVVLTTVIKKGNRIPKRQMETARKRMKEVQDGN